MQPPRNLSTTRRLRVLMLTEGTYPFHWGGVSTWCHLLMRDLPNIDFELLSLAAEPGMESQFALPGNVVHFHTIPLWGVREMLENRPTLSLSELLKRKERTSPEQISFLFLPIFRDFLHELLTGESGPQFMAAKIHDLYRFFQHYDFDTTLRSSEVWQEFVDSMNEIFPMLADDLGYTDARYYLSDLTSAMQWLYHWLFPLGAPLPKADVAHAAMAGICTLIAAAVKYEYGTAIMLTEHGIYLRERYLAEAASAKSIFLKIFSLCFARRMTEVIYAISDQISPCCDYNHRWELRNGAKPEQIRTIYYGVDSDTFAPQAKPFGEPPVVVWVGRIDPLKDLLTLIRAAGIVHKTRPDIEFRLFGSAPAGNEAYYQQCLDLRAELGLESSVNFAGFRSNAASAFNEGDVVVLSSISEAFPFVILEAMLCEKPVVATGVGGIPEQLEGCGYALEPRNPQAMADAILTLMGDAELSTHLGRAARVKAMREFSVRQSGLAHEASYRRVLKRLQLEQSRYEENMDYEEQQPIHRNGNGGSYQLNANRHAAQALEPVKMISGDLSPTFSVTYAHGNGKGHPITVDSTSSNVTIAQADQANGIHRNGSSSQKAVVTSNRRREQSNGHRDTSARSSHVVRRDDNHQREISAEATALAAEVARRDRQPIDALEITAVVESLGVTDEVARLRYSAKDAFDLGEIIYSHLRRTGSLIQTLEPIAPPPRATYAEMFRDLLRGVLALIPAVVLLLCLFAYSSVGKLEHNLVLALSAGMTVSMLVTNGFILALSRRTSIYLSMGKFEAAGRFLWQGTALILSGLTVIGLIAIWVTGQLGLFSATERGVFLLAFLGLSMLWMAAGGLSLVQKAELLGWGMSGGFITGVLATRLAAPFTDFHLVIGSAVGYLVAMVIIGFALRHSYSSKSAKSAKKPAQPLLPSPAYLVHEAWPYFVYGILYMTFILVPHLLGWLGTVGVEQIRSWAITNVELGLTASMPPIILGTGLAEYALRCFWRQSSYLQSVTDNGSMPEYRSKLIDFYWRYGATYMVTIIVFSLVAQWYFRFLIQTGVIQSWVHVANLEELLFIFDIGLIAYSLLGFGIFSCMFCITLGVPNLAIQAVKWGVLTILIIGLPLSTIHYTFSVVGFVGGGVVFVYLAWKNCVAVLEGCDHHFAMTL